MFTALNYNLITIGADFPALCSQDKRGKGPQNKLATIPLPTRLLLGCGIPGCAVTWRNTHLAVQEDLSGSLSVRSRDTNIVLSGTHTVWSGQRESCQENKRKKGNTGRAHRYPDPTSSLHCSDDSSLTLAEHLLLLETESTQKETKVQSPYLSSAQYD